jgi:hypothetical protein
VYSGCVPKFSISRRPPLVVTTVGVPRGERPDRRPTSGSPNTFSQFSAVPTIIEPRHPLVPGKRCSIARRTASPDEEVSVHRAGTGPDSVVVHAVRPGRPVPSGPTAVCGYPLRAPHEDVGVDDLPFENRWLLTDDCCTECATTLELPDPTPPSTTESGDKLNWPLIAAILTLMPMVSALLFRVAIAARR